VYCFGRNDSRFEVSSNFTLYSSSLACVHSTDDIVGFDEFDMAVLGGARSRGGGERAASRAEDLVAILRGTKVQLSLSGHPSTDRPRFDCDATLLSDISHRNHECIVAQTLGRCYESKLLS